MITFKKIKHIFSEKQVLEIERAIDKELYTSDLLDSNLSLSKIRLLVLSKEYNQPLSIEDVKDLSLIYDETIIMCLNNNIPIVYLMDNKKFKSYDDSQLLVIQDGIINKIDIRLFSRNVSNNSFIMNRSLQNLISQKTRNIIHRPNKKMTFKLQLQSARSIFEKLELKLFGGIE